MWENEGNEKVNASINVGNNSNCCTIRKYNKVMFFMSPQEVSYTDVYNHENKLLLQLLIIMIRKYLYSLMSLNQF